MGLNELPRELLELTANFLHPSSIVNYASACKRLFFASEIALKRHSIKMKESEALTDVKSMDLVETLRGAVIDDNYDIYYIRRIEWTRVRRSWLDWGDEGDALWTYDSSNNIFSSNELQLYERIITNNLHLDHKTAKLWIEKIKCGNDEPLRVILLSVLYNLEHIRFSMIERNWRFPDTPVTMLCPVIREAHAAARNSDYTAWPVGFRSISSITLGCHRVSHTIQTMSEPYISSSREIGSLALLPNIRQLVLGGEIGEQSDDNWDLPENSSSLENLVFFQPKRSGESIVRFLDGLRNLRELRWDYTDNHSGYLPMNKIPSRHMSTIEIMDIKPIHNPPSELLNFKNLKWVSLSSDFLLNLVKHKAGGSTPGDLSLFLPPSIELLQIFAQPVSRRLSAAKHNDLVNLLSRSIKNHIARVDPSGQKHNSTLKQICLSRFLSAENERTPERPDGCNGHDLIEKWKYSAIAKICEDMGISLHTPRIVYREPSIQYERSTSHTMFCESEHLYRSNWRAGDLEKIICSKSQPSFSKPG